MTAANLYATTARPRPVNAEKDTRLLTLTILSHPEMTRAGEICFLFGSRVELSRVKPDFKPPKGLHGQPLTDLYISRKPLQIVTQRAGAVELIPPANGQLKLWGKAQLGACHFTAVELDAGVVLTLADRVVLLLHYSNKRAEVSGNQHGLVGHSDAIEQLRLEIDQVADLNVPVLLRGLSGTGKELVATAIHEASAVAGPFVCVNMGAIPPSLAAAELFGAEKGSFTGADRHQLGYFRSAQNGTLFLDELGETPLGVQVLLLRALETGMVSPLGSQKAVPFQTRFLAATDADLENKMKENSFKAPLFHRLSGYEIHLPPLRERLEDIGRLFLLFARKELQNIGGSFRLQPTDPHSDPWLPADLMVKLLAFSWPGNVRQLRNLVRQLVIGCRGDACLKLDAKTSHILNTAQEQATARNPTRKPADIEASEVVASMREHSWDIQAAAASLSISRAALYLLIDKIPELHRATDLDSVTITAALQAQGGNLAAAANQLKLTPKSLRRRANQLAICLH